MNYYGMFAYKGSIYQGTGPCRIKKRELQDKSWVHGILYEKDGIVYCRELLDFLEKFKEVKVEA